MRIGGSRAAQVVVGPMETFDPAELPELLKLYYRRLFPYAQYYRWLNYGGGDGSEGRGAGCRGAPLQPCEAFRL